MQDFVQTINSFIDSKRDEIIETWKEVVNIESFKNDKEGVNRVCARFKELFEAEGFVCKTIDVGPNSGDVLVGVLGADRPGKPVIFGGHMDTVHPVGTFGENPFRIEDGKAYGPGVLDMKGGIIIALYAVKALNAMGWAERPIKIVLAGDEEKLHENAPTAKYFEDECRGGLCEFNMETGLIDGRICVARNGKTEVIVKVEGVGAHAGNDYYSGRNAIAEMAHKIIELQALSNKELNRTVNCGVINGGTMSGAVPAECTLAVDLRAGEVPVMDQLKKEVEAICNKTFIEGTKTSFYYSMEMLPFELTDEGQRLYEFVHDTALEAGYGDFGWKKAGGSSDAAYSTIAGVPSVCSCGVRGEWNHTEKEYAVVESMFERSKLWATVVHEIGKFAK